MDVKCQDIHYSIGEKKILNGVSLEVEGGQFQTILGPNGSGKSTLLKTIYRQLKPDSGQIFLDGKSPRPGEPKGNCKRNGRCDTV